MYDFRYLILFLAIVIFFTAIAAYFNRRHTHIKYIRTQELLIRD